MLAEEFTGIENWERTLKNLAKKNKQASVLFTKKMQPIIEAKKPTDIRQFKRSRIEWRIKDFALSVGMQMAQEYGS